MEHLKEIPFLDKYPIFRKLAAIGDLQKLTPEERDYYEEDVKIMRDLYATDKWEKEKRRMEREAARKQVEAAHKEVETAHKEVETAHKEVETAHKEVEKLRREKEEAEISKSLAIAKELLKIDIPILQIMQATGLTQEQINRLKN